VLEHQLVPLAQRGGALLGRLLAPGRQRTIGSCDRLARLGGAQLRNGANDLARRRVVDVDDAAGRRRDPLPVDIASLTKQLRVRELYAGCRFCGMDIPPRVLKTRRYLL
jgi:hypothetical protein